MASKSKPSSASMTSSCRSSSAIASSSSRRPTATATAQMQELQRKHDAEAQALERQHLQEVQQRGKAAPEQANEAKDRVSGGKSRIVTPGKQRNSCAAIRRKRRRSCASRRPINRRLNASILHNSRSYSVSTRSKCSPLSGSTRSRCRRSRVRPAGGGGGGRPGIARAETGIRVRSTNHGRAGARHPEGVGRPSHHIRTQRRSNCFVPYSIKALRGRSFIAESRWERR